MEVLFVCDGNVGRSPMAEAIFLSLGKGEYSGASAGTTVTSEKEGEEIRNKPAAENTILVMKELDIDISGHKRRHISPEIVTRADIVVIMAKKETIPNYLLGSDRARYWDVPDPFQQDIVFTRTVRSLLTEKVKALLLELGGEG